MRPANSHVKSPCAHGAKYSKRNYTGERLRRPRPRRSTASGARRWNCGSRMPRPTGVCVGSVVGVWSVCGSRWDSVCWRTISWLSGPPASEKPPMDKMERLARTQLKSGTISGCRGIENAIPRYVDVHTPKANVQCTTLDRKPLKSVRNRHQTNTILNTLHEPKSTTVLELKYRSYEMFTIIQEFTEKYRGFRGSLFSIHPLSGCERLPRYASYCLTWMRTDNASLTFFRQRIA